MSNVYVFNAEVCSRQSGFKFSKLFYSYDPAYVPKYGEWDVVVKSVNEVSTDTQYRHLSDAVILFGQLFMISDDHTGRYVFDKKAWDDASASFDDSIKNVVSYFDPAEYDDEYEDDGSEYVVLNFGGELYPFDSQYNDIYEALPMLPWDALSEEFSNIGNG